MAPHERSGLSLRWDFSPVESSDRAVRWRWRAYTQAGKLHAESDRAFETLTECVDEARRHGYRPPAG